MTQPPAGSHAPDTLVRERRGPRAPFLHSLEAVRTVYIVTAAAACAPLLAGVVLFGWRAAVVGAMAIFCCAAFEKLYYRCTYTPALFGRSHAYLTGVLLAITLPAFVPWYVPVVAAAFAVIVGKAIFGGVGHFLWQPALVGRLAVAVMFPATMNPAAWPVLAQNRLLVGDIRYARHVEDYHQWRGQAAPDDADAILLPRPSAVLAGLTAGSPPAYSCLAYRPPESTSRKPPALTKLPPITDLLFGARGGAIGETCVVVIVIGGLYLVYRGYAKWQLMFSIVLAAAVVAGIAPIRLAGGAQQSRTLWWPMFAEGGDVGLAYVAYQLLSGELILAAVFLATEMTSRPVTTGGQVLFGVGVGAIGMVLKLYVQVPIPFFMAVLAMNTLTPTIDSIWRPRSFARGWSPPSIAC